MDPIVSYKLEPSVNTLRQHPQLLLQFQTLKELQSDGRTDIREDYFINGWATFFSKLSRFPAVGKYLILVTRAAHHPCDVIPAGGVKILEARRSATGHIS